MEKILDGRVAVVTGSGNGIGRAEAIKMAGYGAKVVINDIGTSYDGIGQSHEAADRVVEEIVSAGNIAVPNYDSVTTEQGAESLIQTAIDKFGRIDILVNNAGVVRDPKNISEVPMEDWEIVLKTHLFGTFYTTRCACKYMKKQGYGRMVNTSSHVGLGWAGFTAYSAAKEGIAGLTRTVARDMAEFGVTCNAIRPIAAWRGTKESIPRVAVNKPEDVACLVAYLVSEMADHISGCIFEVWRGHVGIFQEPPAVLHVVQKQGSWTTEELMEAVPQKLTKGQQREVFPEILKLE